MEYSSIDALQTNQLSQTSVAASATFGTPNTNSTDGVAFVNDDPDKNTSLSSDACSGRTSKIKMVKLMQQLLLLVVQNDGKSTVQRLIQEQQLLNNVSESLDLLKILKMKI